MDSVKFLSYYAVFISSQFSLSRQESVTDNGRKQMKFYSLERLSIWRLNTNVERYGPNVIDKLPFRFTFQPDLFFALLTMALKDLRVSDALNVAFIPEKSISCY